ncbi:Prokaryotic ATPase [Chitinispirillum alkaliphilum]|nr:Prokaryotic ATPase [Chitinispirillum alkaliphilum]
MIERTIKAQIESDMFRGKAILLYGARQTGKSTLIGELLKDRSDEVLFLNGDDHDIRVMLSEVTSTKWKNIIGKKRIVFIDEAQRIENIGLAIKIITDQLPGIQVIATGSSTFELANRLNEPLTGRKYVYYLPPFSFAELCSEYGLIEEKRSLENRLVFGSYPEVVVSGGEEERVLKLLADSFLFKDILMLEDIKKPSLLMKILRALALQLGSEVSYAEIAQLVGSNKNTVEKYIDLLEKVFVVYTLPALSRNVRNELKKGKKVYFCDNGIRNAVTGNFQPVSTRTDVGALWENYIIGERIKYLSNQGLNAGKHFWRTTQKQEIDYIEERNGVLRAFEFKWNRTKKATFPLTFRKAYPEHELFTVTPENYAEFLGVK